MLPCTPQVVTALEGLKLEKKFTEDAARFYPGAPNEVVRVQAQEIVDRAIGVLLFETTGGLSEDRLWMVLESAARQLAALDSEEQDRGFAYLEEIMAMLGVESSEGRLNGWRYGFKPGNKGPTP